MASVTTSLRRKAKIWSLARAMNRQNIRRIPLIPGIIDLMNLTLTDPEIDYLLKFGTRSYTFSEAAALSGRPEAEFREFLQPLLLKGYLQCQLQDGEERYLLFPLIVGWFEFQIFYGLKTDQQQEFGRMADGILQPFRKYNVPGLRGLINLGGRLGQKSYQRVDPIPPRGRRIAVGQDVSASASRVYPTKTVADLIEEYGNKNTIGTAPCICREWRKSLNDPCRFNFPYESCMFIGDVARTVTKLGYGRIISKTEALEKLDELRPKGVIHTVYHEKDDLSLPELAICNCCWDCCGLYGSYNRGIIPLKYRSSFISDISDTSLCTGCGKCVKFCPTNALSVNDKKVSQDSRICIGCGQCAFQCPKQVFTLRASNRDVYLPIKKRSEHRLK